MYKIMENLENVEIQKCQCPHSVKATMKVLKLVFAGVAAMATVCCAKQIHRVGDILEKNH